MSPVEMDGSGVDTQEAHRGAMCTYRCGSGPAIVLFIEKRLNLRTRF